MSRIHGRNGRIYMAVASGGTASPLPFFASWTISFATEKAEVTAFGDTNKVYVAGLPDASGEFSGFYDDATAQTYTAAADGVARAFYLYPDTTSVVKYFWGTILPDFNVDGAVDGAVAVSATWNAASAIAKVG
ncbi:MAG: hypothetical protein ACREF4_09540 [Gammaproteobacteria bacterium]